MSAELTPEQALAHLAAMTEAYQAARDNLGDALEARDDAIFLCRELGVSGAVIAATAGVSRMQVSRKAPKNATDATESPQKQTPAVRVSLDESTNRYVDLSTNPQIDTSTNRLVDNLPVLSDYVTRRDTRDVFSRRDRTVAAPMGSISELVEVAGRAMPEGQSWRLLVCGEVDPDGLPAAEATRQWALGDPGIDWDVTSAYVNDPELPVIRLKGTGGRSVTIMRAGSWFGRNDLAPGEVDAAWAQLETVIKNTFAGGKLGDTPATTGRALWLRTIGKDTEYPVASAEVRELVQSTSGQGRIELLPSPVRELEQFTQYDGRLMYAAHTWGLGVGEPKLWIAGQDEPDLRGRGWFHVRATVPADWAHVGLLPYRDGGGWEYPSEPGRTFDTWCDGSEAYGARAAGWGVEIVEGITWREGKPLNAWRDRLVKAYEKCDNELTRKALRALLLFTIGAFAARSHPVSKSLPLDRAGEVPPEAIGSSVTVVGDRITWQEPGTTSDWSEGMRHPEWSACVWGRTRAHMARRALAEPLRNVIAFSTDALYVGAPGSSFGVDTGKPGEMRIKGQITSGPVPAPQSWPDLFRLRDQAELEWENAS